MEQQIEIRPSSASRWLNCAGSIQMGMQFPNTSSEAAKEGTASHWIASEILFGRPAPSAGQKDPDGTVIDFDMIDGAWVYVKEISKAATTSIYPESKIQIPRVHSTCKGTCDCWHYDEATRTLHVWDYKYGHVCVEPFENNQLICYTCGILDLLGIDGLADQQTTVVMHIVQPRMFHRLGPHREWRVKASDLRGYINKLAAAATAATLPDPPLKSGEHCKYCDARHACIAAQQAAMFSLEYASSAHIEMLPPEALAIELRTLRRAATAIKLRLTGLEQQATSCIQAGGHVPGFAIERGFGRLKWTKPIGEVFALGDLLGVDLRGEPSAITPTAAKNKGIDETLLTAYSGTEESGVKLVEADKSVASMIFRNQ